ncbi:hypothetical protein BH747_09045 [Enterococcus villorum]|jgi:hypothetical protein|uniref:Uncharacterized protein n=2 Tax=Enterococcus villorum TaxID=112904 RepID=A0A1V8YBQ4_9ENTE|nr:hypothetical protein [Enterococcus villorum]EOH91563.1 hypothetical protein UAO_00896 [Enterococcus villorum ATCC 700913]EOW76941.1 hypothetical protein I591_02249 [Enterococcus villorum ATCC 700913]OQO70043.1 hypothetical protein BH747_09045 [Enterococcus villorum]OQO71867.1 hypothetical protein BH744_13040 [Enterococcus villorum]GEL91864.1 hypothetical protein EVI01_12010 [Enterococcus villorum]
MRQRNTFLNLFMLVMLLIVASFVISLFIGVVSSILWFAIKLLIPLAIVIWLIRTISGANRYHHRRNY